MLRSALALSLIVVCLSPSPAAAKPADPRDHPLALELGEHFVLRPSLQYRARFLAHGGRNFADGNSYDAVMQRARLGLRVDMFGWATAFVQVQDVRSWGEETSTVDFIANGLDVHQAYAEVRCPKGLLLRIGRQEIILDGQRLVGNLDWLDQARSFDGVLLQGAGAGFVGRAFWFRLREEDPTPFGAAAQDPAEVTTQDFFGLHVRYGKLAWLRPSLLGLFDTDSRTRRRRATFGLYADGQPAKGLRYWFELYGQVGTSGRDAAKQDLRAFLVAVRAQYTLPVWGKPTLAGWFEQVSGDGDRTDNINNSFDTLFATNHKFYGFADYFLNIPANTAGFGLIDIGGRFSLRPRRWLKLLVDLHHFRYAKRYTLDGESLLILGHELDAVLVFPINKVINVQGGFAAFLPRRGVTCLHGGCRSDAPAEYWGYLMAGVTL
ncbi:MAG: alginate export family protein [Myxococcales bacterium]|nr:alginate export family protein [Myxococcales bacterium]